MRRPSAFQYLMQRIMNGDPPNFLYPIATERPEIGREQLISLGITRGPIAIIDFSKTRKGKDTCPEPGVLPRPPNRISRILLGPRTLCGSEVASAFLRAIVTAFFLLSGDHAPMGH